MAANIFGDRFAGHREPAWHGLGHVFEEPMTAEAAVVLAKMDYQIHLLPLCGSLETPFGTQLVTVDGKSMIAREPVDDDPAWRYFGIASDKYGMVQNMQLAQMLDKLTVDWPVETVGALDGGKTVFFTLDAGTHEVGGKESETVKKFFLVTDTKDGGTTLKIAFTPVRVVCQNTLVTGLKAATIQGALQHKGNIAGALEFRVDLISRLMKAERTVTAQFDKLAELILTEEDWERVIQVAYPYYPRPKKAMALDEFASEDAELLGGLYAEATQAQELWEYYCERTDAFRAGAKELMLKFNDEQPEVANTGWALYNAIVECEDYRNGSDSVAISTLFGERSQTKRRAFDAVASMI